MAIDDCIDKLDSPIPLRWNLWCNRREDTLEFSDHSVSESHQGDEAFVSR